MNDLIWTILHPNFWLMNYPYCEAWDAHVRAAIASGDIEQLDGYHAKIGGQLTWIENYPHAFGHREKGPKVRPARRTLPALAAALIYSENRKPSDPKIKLAASS